MIIEKIKIKEIQKENNLVVLEDNSSFKIHLTSEGEEFIQLKNPRENAVLGLYLDNICDAITDVKNGYGHTVMNSKNILTNSLSVVYFLNPITASKYNKLFLEEFGNVSLGFGIKFGLKNGFKSYILNNDENALLEENEKPMFFSSEEFASSYIKKTYSIAEDLANVYNSLVDEAKQSFLSDDNSSEFLQFIWHNIAEFENEIFVKPVQILKH